MKNHLWKDGEATACASSQRVAASQQRSLRLVWLVAWDLWVVARAWNAETHACDIVHQRGQAIGKMAKHPRTRMAVSDTVNQSSAASASIENRDACADAFFCRHGHIAFAEQKSLHSAELGG